MSSIFDEMLGLWKDAPREVTASQHPVFCLNQRGMKRYLAELLTVPHSLRYVPNLQVKYDAGQAAEMTISFETSPAGPVRAAVQTPSGAPEFIEFNASHSTGIQKLDEDHRELIDLANRIVAALHAQPPAEVLREAFLVMFDRIEEHFDLEESHMRETSYPDLAEHSSLHNSLIRKLVRISRQCKGGEIDAAKASTLLAEWLFGHVLDADVALGSYLRERGHS